MRLKLIYIARWIFRIVDFQSDSLIKLRRIAAFAAVIGFSEVKYY